MAEHDFNDAGEDWQAYLEACRYMSGRVISEQDEIDELYNCWLANQQPAEAVRDVVGLVHVAMPMREFDQLCRAVPDIEAILASIGIKIDAPLHMPANDWGAALTERQAIAADDWPDPVATARAIRADNRRLLGKFWAAFAVGLIVNWTFVVVAVEMWERH